MKNLSKTLENLYQSKDYLGGIDFLKSNESKFSPAEYQYNLGTFYLKLNNAPIGRYHLEIARKMGNNSSKLEHNLSLAKEKLNLVEIEKPFLFENKALNFFNDTNKDWFISFFLIALFLSLFTYRKLKSLSLSLILLLISLTPMAFKFYLNSKYSQAIVTKASSFYDGPSDIYEEIGDLPLGIKLYLSEKRDESWYFIEFPEAYRGWVNYSKLNTIQDKNHVY